MKMRKLSFLCLLVIVVVMASLVVSVGFATAASEEYKWKIQSIWARGDLSMETLASRLKCSQNQRSCRYPRYFLLVRRELYKWRRAVVQSGP